VKWFRQPKAPSSPSTTVTWHDVIDAGNRCTADMDLIERTALLSPEEKESLKNDALDVFAAVFTSYIRR
jgi:hypothetical protein